MHKFFCNYNSLTERYELALNRNNPFKSNVNIQAQNTLLPQLRELLQVVYDNLQILKEIPALEENLQKLSESELLLSNLYYSLFASPLELNDKQTTLSPAELLTETLEKLTQLEQKINIPEYNRLARMIKDTLQDILNALISTPNAPSPTSTAPTSK